MTAQPRKVRRRRQLEMVDLREDIRQPPSRQESHPPRSETVTPAPRGLPFLEESWAAAAAKCPLQVYIRYLCRRKNMKLSKCLPSLKVVGEN